MAEQKLKTRQMSKKEMLIPTRDHEYDRQVAREYKARQARAKKNK